MLSRLGFDILSAVILAVTAAAGAYTPVLLSQRDKLRGGTGRSLLYVIGNMFSAGVMVSAGFCHLLGEALKQMPHMEFPLAPFLCGCGFLLTLNADKAATLLAGAGPDADGVEVIAGLDLAERGTPGRAGGRPGAKESESESLLRSSSLGGGASGSGGAAGGTASKAGNGRLPRSASDLAAAAAAGSAGGPGGGDDFNSSSAAGSSSGRLLPGAAPATHRQGQSGRNSALGGAGSFEVELSQAADASGVALAPPPPPPRPHAGPNCHSVGTDHAAGKVSYLTAVLMGVALCFHSLLEGAAMGAQATISNSLHIFIAIVSHKGLAAYALGSSIVDSDANMSRFWNVILPFTFASPAGIFLGYIVSGVAQGVGAASISALASGTFLYVAFMEVIPREMHDTRRVGLKLAALGLGYALMSVLAIWA